MKEKVIVDSETGVIPEKGTQYWYVRSCMQTQQFKVVETQWIGGMSDVLRLAKGNVYLDQKECRHACWLLNVRVDQISATINHEQELERRKAEQERVAKEIAEKREALKTKPKKEKKAKSVEERTKAYERNKKNNPHPDII